MQILKTLLGIALISFPIILLIINIKKSNERFEEIKKQRLKKQNEHELYIEKWRSECIAEIKKEVENGLIPIDTHIKLSKDEKVYFELDNVMWKELRKEKSSISFMGITQTITIAKGLRFRLGNVTSVHHTTDVIKTLDIGTLYLSNKNIYYVSEHNTKKIELSKILNIQIYEDAIKIQKQTGKAVFFPMTFKDIMRLTIIADHFINQ